MTITLLNIDNMLFETVRKANLVYADMIYEDNEHLEWIPKYWDMLEKDNGIIIVQSDWHSIFEVVPVLKDMPNSLFLNHISWKNEFGNFPKNKFRQSHDDIVIFSKGNNYKFYPERVQVQKATANSKGLNPSGRDTKLATSVWTDITLTTVSKERIRYKGKCIRWQKPLKLLRRLFSPFVDSGDFIIDNFMGVGTGGVVAKELDCDYVGIELDPIPYSLAQQRLSFKEET